MESAGQSADIDTGGGKFQFTECFNDSCTELDGKFVVQSLAGLEINIIRCR